MKFRFLLSSLLLLLLSAGMSIDTSAAPSHRGHRYKHRCCTQSCTSNNYPSVVVRGDHGGYYSRNNYNDHRYYGRKYHRDRCYKDRTCCDRKCASHDHDERRYNDYRMRRDRYYYRGGGY